MYANHRNFLVTKEVGVKEHDGDIRFQTGSGNMAISHMQNEKKMQNNPYLWPNCRNFIIIKEIGVVEHDGDVRLR